MRKSERVPGKFVQLVVDGASANAPGIIEVRVRFTNGMELIQSDGCIDELFGMVKKMLG